MPIEAIKIPQNVHIEDRIIGPLSLRQILLMAVGGGTSYVLYSLMAKANGGKVGLVATVLVCLPAIIMTMFAIIKINDLSLIRICMLMIEGMNKSPVRAWTPRRGLSITIHLNAQGKGKAEEETPGEKRKREDLERAVRQKASAISELSSVLDSDSPLEEESEPEAEPEEQPTQEATAVTPQQEPPTPRPPVDQNRIGVDSKEPKEDDDGLSAYQNVFRDIEPPSPSA